MDFFYNQLAEDLIGTIEKYSEGDATYEELYFAFLKEEIAFEHKNWEEMEKKLRTQIFESQKLLLTHLSDVEIKLKNIEKDLEGESLTVEGLVFHSRMLSRNKMPLDGYNNSSWYLPFCPNHNLVESLYEDENEE